MTEEHTQGAAVDLEDERALVLVVDDDPLSRESLAMLFAHHDQDVVTAASGTDALRRCLQMDFAVILMDVRMPGLDGYETASRIHARPRSAGVPIIFLTGEAPDLDRLRAYVIGGVDFLLKPIEPVMLRAKVRVFVELWHRRRQVERTQVKLRESEARRAQEAADAASVLERRRADAALSAVLERQALIFRTVPVALFTRSKSEPARIVWASDNVERVLGYPSSRFLTDVDFWRSRVHPADRAEALGALAQVNEGDTTTCTYRWHLADGSWRWMLEHMNLVGEPGGIPQLYGTCVDIHAQKQMEEALREANEALDHRVAERTAELAAVIEDLESFSLSVAHDLRAPLRSIHAYGRILAEEGGPTLSGAGKHAQDRLELAVHRMSQLIDDLLRLSRVARARLEREAIDVTALALQVAAVLREREPDHPVEFVVAPNLTLTADRGLLLIALENLLGNAWKFSRPVNPGRVEVGARADDPSVLFVRDNGVGFDMIYANQLFRPFHRLHSMDEFDGTGIGLATVRRIIQRHGGEVWPEAALGQGATFYFTMAPRAEGSGFRP
ncbi:MAG: response regulator [Pseudomonadota bacterium]|nr:response regulator [Pseudomonadota bacterium]